MLENIGLWEGEAPCNAVVRTCIFAELEERKDMAPVLVSELEERSKGFGTSFSFHHGRQYLNGPVHIYFFYWWVDTWMPLINGPP